MAFRPAELVLDRGSIELVDERPPVLPPEADLLNHFVGLDRKPVNPVEGEVERGKLREPGAWLGESVLPDSEGLKVLDDGAPRRGGAMI